MPDRCPNCGNPALGNTIVEMPTAATKWKVYACVCNNCGTIYRSKKAEEQSGYRKISIWDE